MYSCLIVVKSITYAQKVSKILQSGGLRNSIVRSPRELKNGGCGYTVSIDQRSLTQALMLLKSHSLPSFKVYVYFSNSGYREAET